MLVVSSLGAGVAAALPPGGTFVDDNGNVHEPNIEAIAAAGITRGLQSTNQRSILSGRLGHTRSDGGFPA